MSDRAYQSYSLKKFKGGMQNDGFMGLCGFDGVTYIVDDL